MTRLAVSALLSTRAGKDFDKTVRDLNAEVVARTGDGYGS